MPQPISKMILPIQGFYTKEQEWEVMGSGFLINPRLFITAAHNMYNDFNKTNYSDFKVDLGNETFYLKYPIYKEYKDKVDYNENDLLYHDLAIFYFDKVSKFDSKLVFDSKLRKDDKVEIIGYSDSDIKMDKINCVILDCENSYRNVGTHINPKIIHFHNCFKISQEPRSGNSGGPILKDDINVLGMVLFGSNNCTALKAEYIKEKIIGLDVR